MTRPAAFNKIWGYEALQITDENNEKTQEFMRTGWEGGSDKKAPSASVQNYHMQKTDQALQEVERQGCLSWRNDVPYSKGARVFFHGSTFHALKDNQDVEPQGSRDNGIWYLLPVQVYPTRYDSVEGLGTAAKHNAEDFDAIGSAKTVQEALEALKKALAKIATTGNMADALGILAIEHGGTGATDAAKARDNLGLKAGATMSRSGDAWSKLYGADDELLTTKQFVDFLTAFESIRGNDSGPSNGYQKLPSGLIIQWGYEASVNSNGAGYTSFIHYIQYPFPNNMLFVMGNMYSPGNTGWDNLKLWPKDKNSFYVKRHTSLSNPFDYAYLCIGY